MTITLTWTDANGTATVFNGATGILFTKGGIGLDAPTPENTIESWIQHDGCVLTNRRHGVRSVLLPLFVRHATRAQTKMAELANMLVGPGTLEWSDGTNTRYLNEVIYEGGLHGDLGDAPSPVWRRVVAALAALDPWWYGPEQSTALPVAAPTAFDAAVAFDVVLPFDGGASVSVNVPGDTDAYPVITVNGPATTLTVGSGGLEWSIAAALAAGDVLVVDARPGSRGPSLNGGAIDWSLLTEASRLWMLADGTASVIAGSTGSTGSTTIAMAWSPRYRTP